MLTLFVSFSQVWDVISNQEAVQIVSSTKERGKSAKRLVECATGAWKRKRKGIAVDDCSAICLFFDSFAPLECWFLIQHVKQIIMTSNSSYVSRFVVSSFIKFSCIFFFQSTLGGRQIICGAEIFWLLDLSNIYSSVLRAFLLLNPKKKMIKKKIYCSYIVRIQSITP